MFQHQGFAPAHFPPHSRAWCRRMIPALVTAALQPITPLEHWLGAQLSSQPLSQPAEAREPSASFYL